MGVESEIRQMRREDFGPGSAGDLAFGVVSSGEPCVTYIDDKKNTCGRPPIGTVDVDVRDDLDFFPFCSPDHQQLLQQQLLDELSEQGRLTVPGMNGKERSLARMGITVEGRGT